MRAAVVCLVLVGCGGPSRSNLADTPTATTRRQEPMAPPASSDDKDRDGLNQRFEDMHDVQQARREAHHEDAAPPPGSGSATPRAIKHGPAEQAPDPKLVPAPSK